MLRTLAILACVVLVVALVVVAGSRIESMDVFGIRVEGVDVLAILVGTITGIAAGIPVSILLLVVMHNRGQKRANRELERERAAHRMSAWGPLISTNGPSVHVIGLIESGEEDRPRRADN